MDIYISINDNPLGYFKKNQLFTSKFGIIMPLGRTHWENGTPITGSWPINSIFARENFKLLESDK